MIDRWTRRYFAAMPLLFMVTGTALVICAWAGVGEPALAIVAGVAIGITLGPAFVWVVATAVNDIREEWE